MPPIDKSLKLQIIVAALFVVTYGVLSSFYKIEPSKQPRQSRKHAYRQRRRKLLASRQSFKHAFRQMQRRLLLWRAGSSSWAQM